MLKTSMFRIVKKKQLTIFVSIIIISSCIQSSPSDIGDGGFISEKPCEAPCFLNIIPDVTSEEQLKEIINQTPALSSCKEYDFTDSGGTMGFTCANANFSIIDGKVVGVSYLPSSNIMIQNVISKYGEPERALVFEQNLPDDPAQVGMRLLYDNPCIEVSTEIQNGKIYNVSQNTSIYRVVYLGKELCQKNQQLQHTDTWKGYGSYSISSP
jgi:hypothetical protein